MLASLTPEQWNAIVEQVQGQYLSEVDRCDAQTDEMCLKIEVPEPAKFSIKALRDKLSEAANFEVKWELEWFRKQDS